MKSLKPYCLLFFCLLATMGFAQVQINPPFSMPDVNVVQDGEKAYAFCGTDLDPFNMEIKKFVMPYWRCYSSTDLIHWTFESMMRPEDLYMGASDKCFAGHGIKRGETWYWYFSNFIHNTGVAVSDSPKGPWKDALGRPLLTEDMIDTHEYDKCVFIDDDGQAYMTFGSHKNRKLNYHIVALNDDMISLKEKPRKLEVIGDYSKDTPPIDASFLHKKNGWYYLSWRSPYAISHNVYGPYTYMGEHSAYGHLGFFEFNNQDFVSYTTLKEGYRRRYRFCSIAYINYNEDGSIAPMDSIIHKNGVGRYSAVWPRIEAEWYMKIPDGPFKKQQADGFEVRNFRNGDYIYFPNIHDCEYDAAIEICYASETGGTLSIRAESLNGPEFGRADFSPTGGPENYEALTVRLDRNPPGSLSLMFVVQGEGDDELMRLDWFRVVE